MVAKAVPVGSGGWKLVQSEMRKQRGSGGCHSTCLPRAVAGRKQPRNGTRAGGGREERPDSWRVGVPLLMKGCALRGKCYGTDGVVSQA